MLNRRIQDLQNSRVEFARMIKELNIIILKAETNVTELQDLSHSTSTTLKSSVDNAKNLVDELKLMNDLGNELANKLGSQISILKQPGVRVNEVGNFDTSLNSANTSGTTSYFSDEDLVGYDKPVLAEEENVKKQNHHMQVESANTVGAGMLKSFFSHIVNKNPKNSNEFTATSYYDTLRKVNSIKK